MIQEHSPRAAVRRLALSRFVSTTGTDAPPGEPEPAPGRLLGVIESCRNTPFGLGVIGAGALVGPQPVYAAVGIVMALGTIPVAAFVRRLGGCRALRPAVA